MLAACQAALPADVAVCAAAVADWKVTSASLQKLKKDGGLPRLELAHNPDILASLSAAGNQRPALVIGFAAETENVIEHATAKRAKKGCDWILANDVAPTTGTFGGAKNRIHMIDDRGVETWPVMTKTAVAAELADRIAEHLAARSGSGSGKGPAARRGETAA
jgi:phosphopantothenoylcysteine decarboxylase/phosphopantothenate--cysteine ligase